MKIIIVAATQSEIEEIEKNKIPNHEIQYFIHGVGILSTVFELAHIAQLKPDLIIQCGIVGAYKTEFEIGETIIVENEIFEVGAEEQNLILDLFDLSFLEKNEFPYTEKLLPCPFQKNKFKEYKKVTSLTVSVSSGTSPTIQKRREKTNPDVETMEGAGLHYVCLRRHIPFLQIKTISNYVEIRNKNNWNIPLAIANNSKAVKNIIEQL